MTLRDAALLYADQLKWAVFPVKAGSKIPLTEHGVKDATREHPKIANWWDRWPDANVGVATGRPSGIYVIDLDGLLGRYTWAHLATAYGTRPTLEQATPGGGTHLVYRLPPERDLPNTAKRLGEGIDTRGTGGYILAAPSLHPNGKRYRWTGGAIALLPGWIASAMRAATRPPGIHQAPKYRDDDLGTRYGLGALAKIEAELAAANEGERNNSLNVAAYSVGRLVAAGELHVDARHRIAHVAREIGLPDEEIEGTIRSGLQAGHRHPANPRPRRSTRGP